MESHCATHDVWNPNPNPPHAQAQAQVDLQSPPRPARIIYEYSTVFCISCFCCATPHLRFFEGDLLGDSCTANSVMFDH